MPEKLVSGKPSIAAILRQPSFWGAAMGHCCANYLLYFLISWLPYYLIHERNLSMTSMAGTAGLLYAVDSFSAIAAGWIADRRIRHGANPPLVRRTTMAMGFGIAALSLLACSHSGPRTYWWCLLAIGVGSGIANSASYTVGQTLAGARGRDGGLACRTGSPTCPVSLVRRLQVGSSTGPDALTQRWRLRLWSRSSEDWHGS